MLETHLPAPIVLLIAALTIVFLAIRRSRHLQRLQIQEQQERQAQPVPVSNPSYVQTVESSTLEISPTLEVQTNITTQTSITTTIHQSAPLNNGLSDHITSRLGLERIENFSLKNFFSQAFKTHTIEAVEKLLIVGTSTTTPEPNPDMAVMPNPWLFFWVLTRSLIVYLVLLFAWNEYQNINVLPGLMFVGSFVMPFAVLILFFELNTPRNISIFKVVQLTFIGGVISILISLVLYNAFPSLELLGDPSAGIIEEVAKLAGLIMVLNAAHEDRYPYRLNGLLLGAAVGTGFAAFESAGYALQNLSAVNRTMLDNIHLRAALAPFAHIAWTAITASAYWIARKKGQGTLQTIFTGQFLKLFSVSVVLHMIWNTDFTGPYLFKFWALGFVSWVVIISLAQSGLKEMLTIYNSPPCEEGLPKEPSWPTTRLINK